MALIQWLWAIFLLPAAVLSFGRVWSTLCTFCERVDRHPPSRRALLRQSTRYKPPLQRRRFWARLGPSSPRLWTRSTRFKPPDGRRHYWIRKPSLAWRLPYIFAALPRRGGEGTFDSCSFFPTSPTWNTSPWNSGFLSRWFKPRIPSWATFDEVLAFNATNQDGKGPYHARFDSDSVRIGIDNHATRSLSPNMHHFEDLRLEPVGKCRGLGDKRGDGQAIAGIGTLVFTIQDDTGQWHVIKLPNSLFIPSAEGVLVSPQHWAQVARDNSPINNGTCYIGGDRSVVLYWRQRTFKRTITLDPNTNTPIFYSKAGSRIFKAFNAEFVACDAYHKPVEKTIILPPDLQRQREAEGDVYGSDELVHTDSPPPSQSPGEPPIRKEALTFDPSSNNKDNNVQSDYFSGPVSENPQAKDRAAELLRWHYRLGHLPFSKLQQLAKLGAIPRYLANVPVPKCAACLFGAMMRTPWRTKPSSKPKSEIFVATKPGEVVSVDQMVSTLPGFVAQMTGKLTKRRYTGATVFVDHFSRLKFVFLMESNFTSYETIRAKEAFERFTWDHGVTIRH